MTDQELTRLTKQWSLKYFHRPFVHVIFFNRRLKTTGGRYHLSDHHIDINPAMLTEFDVENLRRIVLHELCHYHLHLTGQDYHHRGTAFKQLLHRVGGARYAPEVRATHRVVWYECQKCHNRFHRARHFDTRRYRCARCGGRLEEIRADL